MVGLSAFANARAQAPSPATIHVRVTDVTGAPIAAAGMLVLKAGRDEALLFATTDSAGRHTIVFVPDSGAYRLAVRKVGYVETMRRLLVEPGDTVSFDLTLARVAPGTELPAIVTTEHYRLDTDPGRWDGFNVRCQSKLASCLKEDYMTERPSYDLSDILKVADGIIPVPHGLAAPPPKMHCDAGRGCRNHTCEPNYFVDGFIWLSGWHDLTQAFGPEQLKGIEVYRTEQPRPLRFEGNPGCGSIVFWTR
jgi:hypothetical protein